MNNTQPRSVETFQVKDFRSALQHIEEQLRDFEDSEKIIHYKMEQRDYFTAYRTAIDALNYAPYDSELNTAMVISMFYQSGATLAKKLLDMAQKYMSDEQIASVRSLLEKTR